MHIVTSSPKLLIVDLFCGAGGTTTGFMQAQINGYNVAKVIACINHDPKAIESHWANYPEVKHFEEDIRTLDLTDLVAYVKQERIKHPDAVFILWASLECTNFSKAKGGQPRNADSRTLAQSLFMKWNGKDYVAGDSYIQLLNPDYIQIENVVEFKAWGPLDSKGKPINKNNGEDWEKWRKQICSFGYKDQWKEMNAADFGAFTSRNRLFGIFAKEGFPIVFPEPTHAKNPEKVNKNKSFEGYSLQKWKAVKEVLNFKDEGISIFNRKKDLSEKTLARIYAGLVKYIAKGDTSFLSKYFSGKPENKNVSVEGPAGSLTTIDHHSLVQPQFLACYYGNGDNISSINQPSPTITTKDRISLIQPKYFIDKQYGGSENHQSIDQPAGVIMQNDKHALVKAEHFIDKQYSSGGRNSSIEEPAGAVLPVPKMNLVKCEPFIMPTDYNNQAKSVEDPLNVITASRKHHYLINPSWGGNPGSVNEPCCVIVARQDKAPLYFVQVETGQVSIAVFDKDTEMCIKIKQFMAAYGIVDIKMRMLRVPELLDIQGFPKGYKLEGNQQDQKKFIGNSVVPLVVKLWSESLVMVLFEDMGEQKIA